MTGDQASGEWPASGEDPQLTFQRFEQQLRQALDQECIRCLTSFTRLAEQHISSLTSGLFTGAALPESSAKQVREQWITAYLTQLGRQLAEQHRVFGGYLQQLLVEEAGQESRQP